MAAQVDTVHSAAGLFNNIGIGGEITSDSGSVFFKIIVIHIGKILGKSAIAGNIRCDRIFSIGVSLSEIVWKLSGSISTVQYSQLLSQNKNHEARRVTTKIAWLCCGVTLLFLLIAFMIPAPIYGWFFGDEFAEAKSILMFLSPGVLAVAISNVWGHYFSAFGELKILILKSFSGVVVAFVLSLVLVPMLGVEGACWVNLMANLVCSLVLGVAYFFDKKQVAK